MCVPRAGCHAEHPLPFITRLEYQYAWLSAPDSGIWDLATHGLQPPVQTLEPSDRICLLPAAPVARPSNPGSTCLADFLPAACSSPARLCLVLGEVSLGQLVNASRPGGQGGAAFVSPAAWAWSGESCTKVSCRGYATCLASREPPPNPGPPHPGGLLLDPSLYMQCCFSLLGGGAGGGG